jgi:hypothetical protein
MMTLLFLWFSPRATWESIARRRRTPIFPMLAVLAPLLVVTLAAEYYGMSHWGKRAGLMRGPTIFSAEAALRYCEWRLGLSIVLVFGAAWLVRILCDTFHERATYRLAVVLCIYSLGSVYFFRLFDAFPATNPWITFGAGILLCLYVLYYGIPRVLKPDPGHTPGLFLASAVSLFLLAALERLLTLLLLEGRIKLL